MLYIYMKQYSSNITAVFFPRDDDLWHRAVSFRVLCWQWSRWTQIVFCDSNYYYSMTSPPYTSSYRSRAYTGTNKHDEPMENLYQVLNTTDWTSSSILAMRWWSLASRCILFVVTATSAVSFGTNPSTSTLGHRSSWSAHTYMLQYTLLFLSCVTRYTVQKSSWGWGPGPPHTTTRLEV